MFKPGEPFYDPNAITADKIFLNVKRKMTKEQAESVLALSKIYRKSSFPNGMLEEAMEVLK